MNTKKPRNLHGYKGTSQLTGLPTGTLYSLVSRGQIPHIRLGPRLVRFDEDEILKWLKKHEIAVSK